MWVEEEEETDGDLFALNGTSFSSFSSSLCNNMCLGMVTRSLERGGWKGGRDRERE
jgi:hypothetical protein